MKIETKAEFSRLSSRIGQLQHILQEGGGEKGRRLTQSEARNRAADQVALGIGVNGRELESALAIARNVYYSRNRHAPPKQDGIVIRESEGEHIIDTATRMLGTVMASPDEAVYCKLTPAKRVSVQQALAQAQKKFPGARQTWQYHSSTGIRDGYLAVWIDKMTEKPMESVKGTSSDEVLPPVSLQPVTKQSDKTIDILVWAIAGGGEIEAILELATQGDLRALVVRLATMVQAGHAA